MQKTLKNIIILLIKLHFSPLEPKLVDNLKDLSLDNLLTINVWIYLRLQSMKKQNGARIGF